MSAKIIDGKKIAKGLRDEVKEKIRGLCGVQEPSMQKSPFQKYNAQKNPPKFAAILVGKNPASQIYVNAKEKAMREVGIDFARITMEENACEVDLIAKIKELNRDDAITAILVQLPLPAHMDAHKVIMAIDPLKDADGLHPVNIGKLASGISGIRPCTPLGCMTLIKSHLGDDLRGLNATVVGCSNSVGKPMALMLLEAECTVTIAHIKTRDVASVCKNADILVVAAGSPGLIRGDWIKRGATVIDVGITRVKIDGGEVEFKRDIEALRVELKGDIDALRSELKGDIANLRVEINELKEGQEKLYSRIDSIEMRQIRLEERIPSKWFIIGIMLSMAGLIVTLMSMPHIIKWIQEMFFG